LPVCWFARYLYWFNQIVPGGSAHEVETSIEDTHRLLPGGSIHLSFTAREDRKGTELLEGLGISPEAKFVTIHNRDGAYLKTTQPFTNYAYHDYRDSDISSFMLAVEWLVNQGYWVVRMGVAADSPITTNNPMIIDYASQGRSDFLDVYLAAKSTFHVGDCTGINEMHRAFRRPICGFRSKPNTIPVQVEHRNAASRTR